MMPLWLAVYQSLLFIAVCSGFGVLYFARGHRSKPGFAPFLVLVVGAIVYIVTKLGVSLVRGTPSVFILTRFSPLGAGLAAVGFCLFVIEYTGIERPVSRRTTAFLFAIPVSVNIAVWVNLEYVWIPTGQTTTTVSGYAWELNTLAVLNQVYLNLVVIVGLLLLVRFGYQLSGSFTTQVGALTLAGIGPLIGNLSYQGGYLPFNLTPVAMVLSACIILWAMTRGQFLDLVPVSRNVVIDSIRTGVTTVDTNHRVVDINQAARQQFGLGENSDVIGYDIDTVFQDLPAWREAYWSSINVDSQETLEIEVAGRYYEIEISPLVWKDEHARGKSVLVRDITERIEREQQLEHKNERLDQFASMVSHEIMNPLHSAQGYLDLAHETDSEADLEKVAKAHNRIETTVDELRALARIEPGAGGTDVELVSFEAAATEAWESLNINGATLKSDVPGGIKISAAPVLLRLIFENLFENAVDHNEPPVTVTVGLINDEGFYVADDGSGIPESDHGRVFESGYTTSSRGVGFGLSIVRELASTHDWVVAIMKSTAGGTRVEITDVDITHQ